MGCPKTALVITNIHPVQRSSIYVQWDIDVSQAGSGPFTFTLLRSGSPHGPWEEIAINLSGYTFNDTGNLLHGMQKDVYYMVQTTDTLIKSLPRTSMRNIPRKNQLIVRKIMRDELKMLKAGNGTEVFVLKKRRWGSRCAECWDHKTRSILKKNCGACYGTSFEGGYFTPIRTWAMIKPTQVGTDTSSQTSNPEVDTANGFIQAFPTVIRGDYIVEPEVNKRWEVTAVTPTEILRTTVHQDITLSRLSTSHEIYKVEVDGI